MSKTQTRADAGYYANYGGHPPQPDVLTDRAIVTSVFPEWQGARAWVLNRPVAGGATTFAQSIVEAAPPAAVRRTRSRRPRSSPSSLSSPTRLSVSINGEVQTLEEGGFAYLPAGATWSAHNNGVELATFHWIGKRYEPLAGVEAPGPVFGNERDMESGTMPETEGKWRTTRMLDPEDVAFDFGVNIVTFEPGVSIPFAETHVMEHGLYVLEGKAVYRLNADWVEVEAGDYMSLRAFCPQACYAGGPSNFRYLLYKDQNRQIAL